MSKLVYTGDIIQNFGKYVPTPYIEKLSITNDRITVRIAIFFASSDYTEPTDMYQDIKDSLYVYGLYMPMPIAMGETGMQEDITQDMIDQMFADRKLPAGDNIYDYFGAARYSHPGGDDDLSIFVQNYFRVMLSEFVDSGEVIYTDDGAPIYKYTYETDEPWSENTYSGMYPDGILSTNPDDLVFLSFSSFAKYDPLYGDYYDGISVGLFNFDIADAESITVLRAGGQQVETQNDLASNPLVNAGTSDIAFEPIFKNNKLQTNPHVQYLTIDGNAYDGVPLIDLAYNYHATIDVSHVKIIQKLSELTGQYSSQRAGDQTLASALEQIEYILSAYSDQPELMLKLRDLQVYFPDKTRGTTTGELFLRYSNMMSNFLSVLSYEPILTKTLLRNAKLVDKRDPNILIPYAQPEEHWWAIAADMRNKENSLEYLVDPPLSIWSSRQDLYEERDGWPAVATAHPYLFGGGEPNKGSWQMGREMYSVLRMDENNDPIFRETESRTLSEDGDPTADRMPRNIRNFGYFYCDLEKIIHTDTYLSRVFNVNKIESLWGGKQLTNLVVDVESATLTRGVWETSSENIFGSNGYRVLQKMQTFSATSNDLQVLRFFASPIDDESALDAQRGEGEYRDTTTRVTETFYAKIDAGAIGDDRKLNSHWPEPFLIMYTPNPTYPELAITKDNAYNQGLTYGSAQGEAFAVTEQQGPNNLSFLIPRNFDLCADPGLGDYRLLAYEFQDFYSADYGLARGGHSFGDEGEDVLSIADLAEGDTDQFGSARIGEFYEFKFKYRDMSANLVISLIQSAQNALAVLLEYLEYAEQFCSYNNIDGNFNKFFADGVKAVWTENDVNTPWARAPIVYNLHRDMLFDLFEGDKEKMKDNARAIMDNINPETGRLQDLQSFYDHFKQLYNDYYTSNGDVMVALKQAVSEADPAEDMDADVDLITNFGSGMSPLVSFKEHTTIGEDFPPIFYNYPEAANAEDPWWDTGDIGNTLVAVMAWGVMDAWYSSYGVNSHKYYGQSVFQPAGGANSSFDVAATPIPFYNYTNVSEWFGSAETIQQVLELYTPEQVRSLWLEKLTSNIAECLGWAKRTVGMWSNHKSGLREANVFILWNTKKYGYTFKKTGNKTGAHCYASRRSAHGRGGSAFTGGDNWMTSGTEGRLDKKGQRVNIAIGDEHASWINYTYDEDVAGISRGFNCMDTNVQGYGSSNVICNPIGYMIKKFIDYAPSYDYQEYCDEINKTFLWTTMHGTATTRNSNADDSSDYAFTTNNDSDKEKIDQAGQYIAVLENWANQIVRDDGGGNTDRYKKVIFIARMVYCMCGKQSASSGAKSLTTMDGYWSGAAEGLFSPTTLLDWLWDKNYAVSWASIDPRNNWLVFDPENDRHRQIYKEGRDIGSSGTSLSDYA